MQNSWSNSPQTVEPSKSELNPLLNPLLEQNLGRWAQVYFTNPPEVRERAVLDLLRQLEDEASGRAAPNAAMPAKPSAESVVCPACDAANGSQQRYCGFCGSPLRARERETGAFNVEPYAPPASDAAEGPETLSFLGLSSPSSSASPTPASGKQEANLQFLRMKDFGSEYYDSEDGHARRWALAGVVVLLLVGAYFGWPYLRSHLPAAQKNSAAVSPAQSGPAETPAATENPQPAPVTAQEQTMPSADSSKTAPAVVEPPAMHAASDSSLNVTQGAVPASMSSRIRNTPPPSDPGAHAPDGTQELVAAERYLNGKGAPRDPAAASRLLWKSVGKQNPRAALLLANLYEHGDGVSKSCAQARILLGVAADKGLAEASQNLRTLESTCQ